jgi:hypothetical protein
VTDIDYKRPAIGFWRKLPNGALRLTFFEFLDGKFAESPVDLVAAPEGGPNFKEIQLLCVESVSGRSGTIYQVRELYKFNSAMDAYRLFGSCSDRNLALNVILRRLASHLDFDVPGFRSHPTALKNRMTLSFPSV